ncbi:MAG: MotE family protein [Thermodesulfovibrionales bacterium]
MKKGFFFVFFIISLYLLPFPIYAQDDMLQFIEKRQRELKEKEESLIKEEERLKVIRKDIDDRIEKYSKILNQIENLLKKAEQLQDEKLDRLVKAYESMPPEEAADKLSALSEPMAIKIMNKMKPKKAGSIMSYMDSKKVASLMEGMTNFDKKFPTR